MITITRQRRSGARHDYVIYEPGDSLPAHVRVVEYRSRKHAMKGEYVTDINGRMVPLLRRVEIGKGRTNFIFPGFCWQSWKMDIFSYPVEKAAAPDKPRFLTGKHMALAALINDGMDPGMAVRKLWPRSGRRQVVNIIRRSFANQEFIAYLFMELGYVKKLKELLKDRDITEETIADEIAGLIQGERVNPTLKKWALETAMSALDANEGPIERPHGLPQAEVDMDAIMIARMSQKSKDLPPAGPESLGPLPPGLLVGRVDDPAVSGTGDSEVEGVDTGLGEGD